MDNCIFCGGPAGINIVERPNGPLHYSRIDCAEYLKKELEQKNLQVGELQKKVLHLEEEFQVENARAVEAEKKLYVSNDTYLRNQLMEKDRLNDEYRKALQMIVQSSVLEYPNVALRMSNIAEEALADKREVSGQNCDHVWCDHVWSYDHKVEVCVKCHETKNVE